MAIEFNETNVSILKKYPWAASIIILLGSLSLLFGIIIKNNFDEKKSQNDRIEYLKSKIKNIEDNKNSYTYLQSIRDSTTINKQQILIDSLQKLLLDRTDKNYAELKKILDIKNKESIITIKPKK